MRPSERCAAVFGSCLLTAALATGCSSQVRGPARYVVVGDADARSGHAQRPNLVCRQGDRWGRVRHQGDGQPVCEVRRGDGSHGQAEGAGQARPTGTTVVREEGAREGGLVASQTSGEIGLQMTQVEQVRRIELVREGPSPDWQNCARVELVSSRRSLIVPGEYRATVPRRGTVRERVWARLWPGALSMLSQQDAVRLRMCGVELDVNASFRRAVAESQRRTIHATLALADHVTMRLRATPSDPGDATWLSLSVRSPNHEYRGCGITILANGDALQLPLFEYERGENEDRYRGRVPLGSILAMAEAIRAVGAVCERRFGFLESHQNQLRDFLMRFKEERSFAKDAGSPHHVRMGAEGTTAL
ncbi:MAG: hypothetical protein OXU20_01220 [Myxococcales bacterium]|nr:hypothetical protein [Myxococcales bacterium]MDD9971607.1 hypothetical protein [Myxococcales bacterium]